MSDDKTPNYVLPTGVADEERLNIQAKLTVKPLVDAVEKWKTDDILPIRFDKQVVVDFGCGVGAGTDLLTKLFPGITCVGVDNAPDSIQVAQRKYGDQTFVVGNEDDENVQKQIAHADIVFMRFVVMHQHDPRAFLHKIVSHMKEGAILLTFEAFTDKKFIESSLPADLLETMLNRCKYRTMRGDVSKTFPNFAPKVVGEFNRNGLKNVDEIHLENFTMPLEHARSLLTKNFDPENDILVTQGLVTKKEILECKKVVEKREYDDVVIYLGDAMMTIGTKQ